MLAALACSRPAPVAARESLPAPGTAAEASSFVSGPVIGTLLLPGGARPAGLVVLLQEMDGHNARGSAYAEQLLAAGIAVLDVLQHDDNPAAMAQGLQRLATLPRLAGLPVGLVGFGAGARLALAMPVRPAARVLLYPGCAALPADALPAALLLLHGGADETNAEPDCAAAAAALQRQGHAVRRIGYRHAGFAWDYVGHGLESRILLPRPLGEGRVAVRPWPELAQMSASQVAGFLAASFAAAGR